MAAHSRTKSSSLRASSYRHIFGDTGKETNRYEELKNPLTTGEGSYCKANSKFFAVPKKGGGGPVYVIRHEDVGRIPINVPLLSVHKGQCWDFDFNPFVENMIATVSDDCKVAVTTFPMEGLKETITEPNVVLDGHNKKPITCEFHPTAKSILATGGFDRSVRIWNIESAANVSTYEQFEDTLYSMGWNHDGSLIAASSKDKKIRIFDPRQLDTAQALNSFDGAQSSKIFWVQKFGWIGATGFSKTAKRQLKLFDVRKSNEMLLGQDIDQAAGVILPHWDNDNGVLYLVGKGEGNVNYYELENDEKKLYNLGAYRSTVPQKGGGWLPKKAMDVWKCEVARFLKLTESSVIPISFIVPRKAGAEVFQKDIYPDAYASLPALSPEEWLSGQNKDPILISMDPKNSGKESKTASSSLPVKNSPRGDLFTENERLRNENRELQTRIRELEQMLKLSNVESSKEESITEERSMEEIRTDPIPTDPLQTDPLQGDPLQNTEQPQTEEKEENT